MNASRRLVAPVLLGALPIAITITALVVAIQGSQLAFDFHHEIYPEAKAILAGSNPYPPADSDLSSGRNQIWPIAAEIPVLPLTLLPAGVADGVATVLVLASLIGTLWLLGVRDWRVYGAALLWPPVINAYQTANATLPLCLLCALAWKYRRRGALPGLLVGATLAAKFFLWPLVVWLAATRRYTAAVTATVLAALSLLLIVPFATLREYLSLVANLSRTFDQDSYTLYALLAQAGVPSGIARGATIALGGTILGLAWKRRSFTLAIGAALILSPIVWLHFLALLLVPFALAFPEFNVRWLLPLPLWFVPGTLNGVWWQTALTLIIMLSMILVCERAGVHETDEPDERVPRQLAAT